MGADDFLLASLGNAPTSHSSASVAPDTEDSILRLQNKAKTIYCFSKTTFYFSENIKDMFLINTIFNETELAIFHRQTGFTFSECFRSTDETICALDPESAQIFIGKDLLTRNVHSFGSIVSVDMKDKGCACISFTDSDNAMFAVKDEDGAAILSALKECIHSDNIDDGELGENEEYGKEDVPEEYMDDNGYDDAVNEVQYENDRLLVEVYSRLLNTGRINAINYLVSEIGMSAEDAAEYVNSLDGQDKVDNSQDILKKTQTADAHIPNDKDSVLAIVKELKPGDKIHVEYKPLLGKPKVYDADFVKLEIKIFSRYFSLYKSADTFASFMDEIAFDLFDNIKIHFFCLDNCIEHSVALGGVRELKKL